MDSSPIPGSALVRTKCDRKPLLPTRFHGYPAFMDRNHLSIPRLAQRFSAAIKRLRKQAALAARVHFPQRTTRALLMALILSTPCSAASKPHIISFGKWTPVDWIAGSPATDEKHVPLKVRLCSSMPASRSTSPAHLTKSPSASFLSAASSVSTTASLTTLHQSGNGSAEDGSWSTA